MPGLLRVWARPDGVTYGSMIEVVTFPNPAVGVGLRARAGAMKTRGAPEQPQRPDLQTANQTSARADTIPHQLKITFAQRETADQILGGYLHRETVQHRTIVITHEAAASHINHPETEPSSHHPQPHQHHSPRHPGHPTSNSTVTSRPFTGRTPHRTRLTDMTPQGSPVGSTSHQIAAAAHFALW